MFAWLELARNPDGVHPFTELASMILGAPLLIVAILDHASGGHCSKRHRPRGDTFRVWRDALLGCRRVLHGAFIPNAGLQPLLH
jgi:hypothetical protein